MCTGFICIPSISFYKCVLVSYVFLPFLSTNVYWFHMYSFPLFFLFFFIPPPPPLFSGSQRDTIKEASTRLLPLTIMPAPICLHTTLQVITSFFSVGLVLDSALLSTINTLLNLNFFSQALIQIFFPSFFLFYLSGLSPN